MGCAFESTRIAKLVAQEFFWLVSSLVDKKLSFAVDAANSPKKCLKAPCQQAFLLYRRGPWFTAGGGEA
jgi:hypothetical protein